MPEDDGGGSDNVVHLGTGDLAAIGKVLREMYSFYLQSEPSPQVARLMKTIGEGGTADRPAADADGSAAARDITP
jgi:hypothetical protein